MIEDILTGLFAAGGWSEVPYPIQQKVLGSLMVVQ